MEKLAELVDASLKFTRVLQRKGVSQATLQVAVRCRPLTKAERRAGARTITRLLDDKVVVLMDPDDDGEQHQPGHQKKQQRQVGGGPQRIERRYTFDSAFDGTADNRNIYLTTARPLVQGVLKGVNATVFAYGATGSGKTYTMVGTDEDPGLMVLSLQDMFQSIANDPSGKEYDVTCSYLEVYNEMVYDLLQHNSGPLELREDPEQGAVVSGLRRIKVESAKKIFSLLQEGNLRRKTESTDANATSSRSHAVLEILVTRSDKNHYEKRFMTGKLALVDLAGAERASETNNRGHQLRDGANINRSLLALANCINALGKRKKKGFVFVPFRNSKLTRILKDGLCGNSRTAMIATVSGSSLQYEHSVNTLKYADRAKEIKTHVRRNSGTVESHISEYQRIIDALQEEVSDLRQEVARAQQNKGPGAGPSTAPDMAWFERTTQRIVAAAEESLTARLELANTEADVRRYATELAAMDERLAHGPKLAPEEEAAVAKERVDLAAKVADSEVASEKLREDVALADTRGEEVEAELRPSTAAALQGSHAELRLLCKHGREESAVSGLYNALEARDAVIARQQEALQTLWRALERSGVEPEKALQLGAADGGGVADWSLTPAACAASISALPPLPSIAAPTKQVATSLLAKTKKSAAAMLQLEAKKRRAQQQSRHQKQEQASTFKPQPSPLKKSGGMDLPITTQELVLEAEAAEAAKAAAAAAGHVVPSEDDAGGAMGKPLEGANAANRATRDAAKPVKPSPYAETIPRKGPVRRRDLSARPSRASE